MHLIDTDKWQEIINSLRKQKLRTGLTAFGVFWGIFMLIILLGLGTGYGNKVELQFRGVKNFIWIWSSSPTQLAYEGLGKGRRISLTEQDITAIQHKLTNIKKVDGVNRINNKQAVYNKKSGSFTVYGTHAGLEPAMGIEVIQGRYINELDNTEKRKVAVIGVKVRDILFKKEDNPIGKNIEVEGISFQIVGIYKSTELDNPYLSTSIDLPSQTLKNAYNQADRYTYIIFEPKQGYDLNSVLKDVKKIIYENKKIHPEDSGVINSYDNGEEYRQNKSIVTGVIGFSWLVAIGTIIAGVIGVGNIMLVVVKERTREIGLRKALGATPTKISLMIVQESLIITVFAGYAGLVAGVFSLEAIKKILISMGKGEGMFASPHIDIYTAFMALTVLVVGGILASLLPAMKAASVNPIIALQDE